MELRSAVIVLKRKRPFRIHEPAADVMRDIHPFRNIQNQEDLVFQVCLVLCRKNPVDAVRIRLSFLPSVLRFPHRLCFLSALLGECMAHPGDLRVNSLLSGLLPVKLLPVHRNHKSHLLENIQILVHLGICHLPAALRAGIVPDSLQLLHIMSFHVWRKCKSIFSQYLLDCLRLLHTGSLSSLLFVLHVFTSQRPACQGQPVIAADLRAAFLLHLMPDDCIFISIPVEGAGSAILKHKMVKIILIHVSRTEKCVFLLVIFIVSACIASPCHLMPLPSAAWSSTQISVVFYSNFRIVARIRRASALISSFEIKPRSYASRTRSGKPAPILRSLPAFASR